MKKFLPIVITICLISISSFTQTTRHWSGGGIDGSFSDKNNWDGITIPVPGDNLYFDLALNSSVQHWAFCDYGANSFFNEIIIFNGTDGISIHGNYTHANKFENHDSPDLFWLMNYLGVGNIAGNNLQINPLGGDILVKGELWDAIPQTVSTVSMDCNAANNVTLQVNGNNNLLLYSNIIEDNTGGIYNASLQLMAGSNPTVILYGSNSYTGISAINGGKLQLNHLGGTTLPITNNVAVNGGILQISTNQTLNDLSLETGSTLIVDDGVTLTINGTFHQNGGIVNLNTTGSIVYGTNACLTYGGSVAQVTGSELTAILPNLTIQNTSSGDIRLNSPVAVTGIFTPAAGTLTTNGNLTLKSTSISNTAMVGVVGGIVNGNITLERFIPGAQRSFRFLTPGVTTSSSIHANWQEGATSNTNNPNPHYGTHITGNTVDQTNGFDATETGNPSLFVFSNDRNQSWGSGINNTNTNVLTAGQAYRILIRGDRSTDLTNDNPTITATTLRATGILQTGNINFNTTSTPAISGNLNDYSFIGNPYWAPVDWESLAVNNISSTYWLWDPTMAGTNNRGAYVAYNGTSHTGNAGAINKYIQAGQAIFIQTTGSNPSLLFTENNKAVNSANFTTTFEAPTNQRIDIKLNLANTSNSADAAVLVFNNSFHQEIGMEDAKKLNNPDENIAVNNNNQLLSIDARPLPTENDTIHLSLTNLLSNAYTIKLSTQNLEPLNSSIFLFDKYTQQNYLVDRSGAITEVPYAITADTASKASNRLMLVFKSQSSATTLSDITDKFEVNILTNPITDHLILNFASPKQGNTTIRLMGSNGQPLNTLNMGMQQKGQLTIPVHQYSRGLMLVEVQIGNDTVVKKVIKN